MLRATSRYAGKYFAVMHQAISFTPWDDTQAQLRSLACSNVEVPETKPCASRRASCFTLGFRDPLGSKDV